MSSDSNKQVVKTMWQALSDMDWDTMKRCMHPDIHYEDVPSDDPGADGPDNCVKRLQIAFNHLDRQDQETHHIAAEGNTVFVDHTETWTFKRGEVASHTFATLHEMRDGKVVRWSDYWDVGSFVGQFPDWFVEIMMQHTAADFSD